MMLGPCAYCSASLCPSNTAGWQVWFIADSAAHMRAAIPALPIGPAISRSSIVPGFWPSRMATTGRRPSNKAGWLVLSVIHRVRRPSTELLPPTSMPNSVLVAIESAAVGVPVARCPAATRLGAA